jgi:hypothetical protein
LREWIGRHCRKVDRPVRSNLIEQRQIAQIGPIGVPVEIHRRSVVTDARGG